MPKNTVFHNKPKTEDYRSAQGYLELLFPDAKAEELVKQLKSSKIYHKKAKDILRASLLDLLPVDNLSVQLDMEKVRAGKPMSPIMLVRNDARLIIADGYHRLCAAHYFGEEVEIACQIA